MDIDFRNLNNTLGNITITSTHLTYTEDVSIYDEALSLMMNYVDVD